MLGYGSRDTNVHITIMKKESVIEFELAKNELSSSACLDNAFSTMNTLSACVHHRNGLASIAITVWRDGTKSFLCRNNLRWVVAICVGIRQNIIALDLVQVESDSATSQSA